MRLVKMSIVNEKRKDDEAKSRLCALNYTMDI